MDYDHLQKNIEDFIMSEFKDIYFEEDKLYRMGEILSKYREWRGKMWCENDLIGVLFYKIKRKEIIILLEKYELFVKVPNKPYFYSCNYKSTSSSSVSTLFEFEFE